MKRGGATMTNLPAGKSRVFVIAEAGSTWRFGDDLKNAIRMIEIAKQSGANAFKLQWTTNATLMAKRRHALELAVMYERYLEYPYEWLILLKQKCDDVGIEFMVTGYIQQDIPMIIPLIKRAKISSFEAADSAFVAEWLSTKKQVILSTGLMSHDELWQLSLNRPNNLTLLHCVSSYPCPAEELNLNCIRSYRLDGFSDHSTSTYSGGLAVLFGAKVIEKHCRLIDTPEDNPDFQHSLSPDQLHSYVRNIRETETLLPQDKLKRPIRGFLRYKVWCSKCGKQTHTKDKSSCQDCKKLYLNEYYKKNRPRALAYAREIGQAKKLECLSAYSRGIVKCACCGEREIAFLTLDHMNNDGKWHRETAGPSGYGFYAHLRKRGYPQNLNLQVMCFNCNCGRRVNKGTCPHAIKAIQ